MRNFVFGALIFFSGIACVSDPTAEQAALAPDLVPVLSSLAPGEEYYAPQPHRDHPYEVELSADARTAYVALRGDEAEPGNELAVVDTASLEVRRRIRVGLSPNDVVLHPNGRHLVVLNRFSAFMSVIDTSSDEEVSRVPAPYYAIQIAFNEAGTRAWVTNRWLDSVLAYDVSESNSGLQFSLRSVPQARLRDELRSMPGIPVGQNPRGLALDESSGRLFVANLPDLTISVIDIETDREIDTDGNAETRDRRAPPGVTRIPVRAPVSDVVVIGRTLFVATVGRGTGHLPDQGPDTDGDGLPGDGTPNRGFHDLQNEIATYDTRTFEPGVRYTSDSIVGFAGDAPEGTPGLPPPEERIIIGAVPERLIAVSPSLLAMVASGTGEVSFYDVDGERLTARSSVFVGLFPYGVALDSSSNTLFVANRLSEDLARVDASGIVERSLVGDVSGGAYPGSDAEIGELVMLMTPLFSADQDTSCEHCHRELGGQQRLVTGEILASPFAFRATPASKNLLRTLPWMFENFLDEKTFAPQLNLMVLPGNFGPGAPLSEYADREAFFVAKTSQYVGRTRSFGDSISERPLDFKAMSEMLGLAMMVEPRLLPNPNPPDTFGAQRGKALFNSAQTACSTCHPEPQFALSTHYDTNGLPLEMRMLSPSTFEGLNLDLLTETAKTKFGIESNRFGVPTLRGIWDRNEMFFHDGRAESLLEAIATPDHPALGPGQRGFNERDGVLDIHGGTSHLTPSELGDLIEYILSLE